MTPRMPHWLHLNSPCLRRDAIENLEIKGQSDPHRTLGAGGTAKQAVVMPAPVPDAAAGPIKPDTGDEDDIDTVRGQPARVCGLRDAVGAGLKRGRLRPRGQVVRAGRRVEGRHPEPRTPRAGRGGKRPGPHLARRVNVEGNGPGVRENRQ